MIEQCTEMMQHMGEMMGMGMMGNGMMGGGMMGAMMLGTLLVFTLIVVGIVLLVRLLSNRTSSTNRDALAILEDRFARGEIDREEYQERRSTLRSEH